MTCIRKKEADKKDNCTIIRIPDELWGKIRIILPKEKPSKTVGRPIVPFRKVLDGILYILRTGCQWKMLPSENTVPAPPATGGFRSGFSWMFLGKHG